MFLFLRVALFALIPLDIAQGIARPRLLRVVEGGRTGFKVLRSRGIEGDQAQKRVFNGDLCTP